MSTIINQLLAPGPNGARKPPPPPPGAPEPENDVTDWPEPEDLGAFDAPPLPDDCLPPWMADLVASVSESYEVPPEIVVNYLLGVLSAALCGRLDVRCAPAWTEPVCLYLATVLPSGERKSAVTKLASLPLVEAEKALVAGARVAVARAQTQRTIKEARAKTCERQAAEHKEADKRAEATRDAEQLRVELAADVPPVLPRILADDVTPEQATTVLYEQDGRLGVISAEGSLLDSISRYVAKGAPPAIDVLLRAHAADTIRVDRRGRSEYIESPRLTIAVAVQPAHMARWGQSPDVEDRGLLARFAIFYPKGRVGFRTLEEHEVDGAAYGQFVVIVQRLVDEFRALEKPHSIVLGAEAAAAFLAWRRIQEPRRRPSGDLGHLTAFSSKSEGLVARIAAIFCAAEAAKSSPGVLRILRAVSLEEVSRAIRLVEAYTAHATGVRHLIKAGDAGSDVRAAGAWIAEHPEGFTTRELHQALKSRFASVDGVREVLGLLALKHWIRKVRDEAKGGRPRERWKVNPSIKGLVLNILKTPLAGAA